jgi:hypothetical protein
MPHFGMPRMALTRSLSAAQKFLAIFVQCNICRFAAVELRGARRISRAKFGDETPGPG